MRIGIGIPPRGGLPSAALMPLLDPYTTGLTGVWSSWQKQVTAYAGSAVRSSDGAEADDMIEGMGRDTSARRNARRGMREVRDAIDGQLKRVPGWREADEAYQTAIRRDEAFSQDQQVFQRRGGSPAQDLRGMASEVRQRIVQGARDAVAEIMGTARNDATAAQRELMAGTARRSSCCSAGRRGGSRR